MAFEGEKETLAPPSRSSSELHAGIGQKEAREAEKAPSATAHTDGAASTRTVTPFEDAERRHNNARREEKNNNSNDVEQPNHLEIGADGEDDHGESGVSKEHASATPEPAYLKGPQQLSACGAVTLACFLMLLDTSIVSTAVPRITDEFHSLNDVGWYGSAYMLASAALQPLTGKMYMHFSLKWCFLFFFFLFEVGSLLSGVATSSKMLIVGRAVAGMGASGLMNGGLTIIAIAVPLHHRALAMGTLMGVSQIGVVLGPLLGGVFTDKTTWRWCFYINLPIGALVALLIIAIHIPEQAPKQPPLSVLPRLHHHLDLLGFALLASPVIMLLLALEWGGSTYPWDSSTVIGLFCGAGATLLVWIAWNWYRGMDALIPFSMVSKRPVWTGTVTTMMAFATLFIPSYFLPIYFQAVRGDSPIMSGVSVLPSILAQLTFAVLTGALVTKTGYAIPYSIFAAILSSVGCGLFSLLQPDTSTSKWIGYQIFTGAGRGAGMQMPIVALQAALSQSDTPVAMSMIMFGQTLASAIFLTIANTVFGQSLETLLPEYAPNADAAAIIAAGATHFRSIVSAQDLPGVLQAYADSVDRAFYVAAGAGSVAFFSAWGMGWVDIRKKKDTAVATPAMTEAEVAEQV